MSIVINALLMLAGLIIFSMSVSNIILILFFAIPFTKKLEKVSLLKHNNIINSYKVAIVMQLLILLIPTTVFFIIFSRGHFAYLLIGYMFSIFGIIAKLKDFKLNMDNFSDYFAKNKKYFWEELVEKFKNNDEELLKYITALIDYKRNLSE
jgi:hypothetical protein